MDSLGVLLELTVEIP